MSENPHNPAEVIKVFNRVATVRDAGENRYTITGRAGVLTSELAKIILSGVLRESGCPALIKEFLDVHPEDKHWRTYYVEVEVI